MVPSRPGVPIVIIDRVGVVLYLPPADDAGRDGEGKTPHLTASQTPTQNDLKTPHYTVRHPLFSGILQLNTYTHL